MTRSRFLVPTSLALFFAGGWAAGCAADQADPAVGAPAPGGTVQSNPPGTPTSTPPAAACPACVTSSDCKGGEVCAQFGSDIYCAPPCQSGGSCASGRVCSTVSSYNGNQVDVCVPTGDVCGVAVGPGTPPNAGRTPPPPPPPSNTCGTLVGPSVSASCNSCGSSHTCQANGCYGGWWCDTSTDKCQAAPSNCGTGGGTDSGTSPPPPPPPPPSDAGPGTLNGGGGTVSRLFFHRRRHAPAERGRHVRLPDAIITRSTRTSRALSRGRRSRSRRGTTSSRTRPERRRAAQLDLYTARVRSYSDRAFPAMGNHECTGVHRRRTAARATPTASRTNFTASCSTMLAPIGQTNAELRDRHQRVRLARGRRSSSSSPATPGIRPRPTGSTARCRARRRTRSSCATSRRAPTPRPALVPPRVIMAKYPYTLVLRRPHAHLPAVGPERGHHRQRRRAAHRWRRLRLRPDQPAAGRLIAVDVIDYSTGLADASFHFAVKPEGSPAQ